MKNKPKIFLIADIVAGSSPLKSALIISGGYDPKREEMQVCPKCKEKSRIQENYYLVEGFDDFLEYDLSEPAFLGFCVPPLFTTRDNAKLITAELSGSRYAITGYDVWGQIPIRKKEYFTREPLLGCVEIVGRCKGAYFKSTLKPLPVTCDYCRNMYGISSNDVKPHELLYNFPMWDGSDIFEVYYGYNIATIITEDGIKKLNNLGFNNLIYEEVFWY